MNLIISVLLILVGFVLLIKGADFLVDGSSNVAKKFHIPEIVIGLTIISMGTSMPELFVSLTSALDGKSDMAIGNVVGSNLVNLLLILGVSSLVRRIDFKRETRLIEIPICLAVTIIFTILANINQDISRIDAIILIVAFLVFIAYTVLMAFKGEEFDKDDGQDEEIVNDKKNSTWKDILCIIIGIVALKFGGDLTVDNAVVLAEHFKWSEKLIGVTILAIGTSLPEFVTSVFAAIKGKSDIAIGNILGSNIFNMLLIIGTSAIITPITYNVAYNKDFILLTISTVILAIFPFIPPVKKMSRRNGFVFTCMYIGYMISLFV